MSQQDLELIQTIKALIDNCQAGIKLCNDRIDLVRKDLQAIASLPVFDQSLKTLAVPGPLPEPHIVIQEFKNLPDTAA